MKSPKTNAIRILESRSVDFRVYTYDSGGIAIDAPTVAGKLGVDPARLFKTLVTRDGSRRVLVFCIPGSTELNLKKAESATGARDIGLVPVSELLTLTGYVRGGCSPIGMTRSYPVFIDETAELFESVIVSAGRIGVQIELEPADLASITGALFVDLA